MRSMPCTHNIAASRLTQFGRAASHFLSPLLCFLALALCCLAERRKKGKKKIILKTNTVFEQRVIFFFFPRRVLDNLRFRRRGPDVDVFFLSPQRPAPRRTRPRPRCPLAWKPALSPFQPQVRPGHRDEEYFTSE